MYVSEDGTVTGSIDRAQLGRVEAKTDEARAQVDALIAQHRAGDEQVAAHAQRLHELAVAQNPTVRPLPDTRNEQGVETQGRPQYADQSTDQSTDQSADQTADADAAQAEPVDAEAAQGEDVDQLRTEAEGLGVRVDRRWGPDRLRAEIDAARAEG